MDKLKIMLQLLLLLLLLTPKRVISAAPELMPSSVSGMSQFIEQRAKQSEEEPSWTHLLPSNYYSELNQQYYVRFRRQSMLSLKDLQMRQPYPFEYARYL